MKQEKTDLEEAKEHLEGYVSDHLQLAKLEVAERTAKVAASMLVSLSVGILGLIALGFLSFALAFYLGDILGGVHWGFLIVGGFYLTVFVLYSAMGRPVLQRAYANGIIKKMFNRHD